MLILVFAFSGLWNQLIYFCFWTTDRCYFIAAIMQQVLRRYIGKRLADYYAQPADKVVGKSAGIQSANLSRLLGEWHWRRVLKRFYEEREGHWLTPVELFQPYFSHVLADFCTQAVQVPVSVSKNELHIVELGGGRGTNANLILSYLQMHQPDIYRGVTYTLVDSSPSLHKLQRSVLLEAGHADRVRFQQTDLTDVAENRTELLSRSDIPTVVIAMEVLDNLPHDKVQAKSRKQIQQAVVVRMRDGTEKEIFVPLEDLLLAKTVQMVPSYIKQIPSWIPSVACGVLDHLISQRPNLGVVLADFDWLPAPHILETETRRTSEWADGEPIITDMDGVDHECYLHAPRHCDILFPTDFDKLGVFVKRRLRKDTHSFVHVQKQSEFLEYYGAHHVAKTKSWLTGHTPLLHDFVNCSVLTVTTKAKDNRAPKRQ